MVQGAVVVQDGTALSTIRQLVCQSSDTWRESLVLLSFTGREAGSRRQGGWKGRHRTCVQAHWQSR